MKKILTKLLLSWFIIWLIWINFIPNTYAKEWNSNSWSITTIVTEKIPWAWCKKINNKWKIDPSYKPWDNETQMYKCSVQKWFGTVIIMLWNIIKYFTFIASLWAVLFIILNGIMYTMWWAEPSMKDDAKKRITWTLIWLVLLLLSWVILNAIAPWIYK